VFTHVLQFIYLLTPLLCFCVAEDDVTSTTAGYGHENQTSEIPLTSTYENSADWQRHVVLISIIAFFFVVLVMCL